MKRSSMNAFSMCTSYGKGLLMNDCVSPLPVTVSHAKFFKTCFHVRELQEKQTSHLTILKKFELHPLPALDLVRREADIHAAHTYCSIL